MQFTKGIVNMPFSYHIRSFILVIIVMYSSHDVHCGITFGVLPSSIYDCFEKYCKYEEFKNEPAERIATTCLTTYAWKVTGVRCSNVSQETLDFIGGLLLPYLQKDTKREKRQSGVRRRMEYRQLSTRARGRFHRALQILKRRQRYLKKHWIPTFWSECWFHVHREQYSVQHTRMLGLCSYLPLPPYLHNRRYDEIAAFHSVAIASSAHGGPAFLPWHRVYLFILENALRRIDPSVTIPYWDSNLDANMLPEINPRRSIIWTRRFVGRGNGRVTNGPFASWNIQRNIGSRSWFSLISDTELRQLFRLRDTASFSRFLENIHNAVHVWVGGYMVRIESAPRDIVFFLHHCYIDYLWWQWQWDNRARRSTWAYPPNAPQGHRPRDRLLNLRLRGRGPITNREGYGRAWAFNYVRYRRTPDCSRNTCRGPFLQCKPGGTRWEFSFELWRWTRITTRSLCTSVTRSNRRRSKRSSIENDTKKGTASDWYVHTSLYHDWEAPYEDSSHPKHPSIEESESLTLPKSHINLGEHPGLKDSHGHPIQNDFRINCEQDTSLWAFLPIKVVHLRSLGKMYDSYPVTNGYLDPNLDIYSDLMYRMDTNYTKPQNPKCFENCIEDDTGYSRITIRSDGLNYHGMYSEYIIMDNRQPIDSHVGYIGIRRPDKKASEVLITAQDQCGRICIPKCLKKGSNPPEYEPCSGVVKVDSKKPHHYGYTYSDAVLKYWSIKKEGCPSEKEGEVYLKFYCDYKRKWFPWPGARKNRTKYQ